MCKKSNPGDVHVVCCLALDHDSDHAHVSLSGLVLSTWTSAATSSGMTEGEERAFHDLEDAYRHIQNAIDDADSLIRDLKRKHPKTSRLFQLLDSDVSQYGEADSVFDFPFDDLDEWEEGLISYG